MLEDKDLKRIKGVVKEVVKGETDSLRQEFGSKLDSKLEATVGSLRKEFKSDLESSFGSFRKEVKLDIEASANSLRQEFKSDLKSEISSLRQEFKSDMSSLRQEVKSDIEASAGSLRQEFKKEFRSVRSDISKLRRDINLVIGTFDRYHLGLRRRVRRIEEFLKLEPLEEMV